MQSERKEQRPFAARQFAWSRRFARYLAARGVSPNSVSMVGLATGIAAGVLFTLTDAELGYQSAFWIVGALLVYLRILGSMFDGMVAALQTRRSAVGELYNEVPDRVADAAALVGFGFAVGSNPWLGLAAALLAVFTAYVRTMGKAAGAPQEFCGPMAKPQRMYTVAVAALFLGCGGAALLPEGRIAGMTLPVLTLWVIIVGCAITILRRLRRIVSALRPGSIARESASKPEENPGTGKTSRKPSDSRIGT